MHAELYQGASGPLVKVGKTAILKITVVRALPQYQGSTRNGVTSHDFGPYGTAHRLAAI